MHNPRVNSLKKSVLARFSRHEGEGRMNWRTRSRKYSPSCPLVRTSGMTYRTVLTTGRDENTSCRVGNECTKRSLSAKLHVSCQAEQLISLQGAPSRMEVKQEAKDVFPEDDSCER